VTEKLRSTQLGCGRARKPHRAAHPEVLHVTPRCIVGAGRVSTPFWLLDKSTYHSEDFASMHRWTIASKGGDAGRCVDAPSVAVGYAGIPWWPFACMHPTAAMAYFDALTGANLTIPRALAELYVSERLHASRRWWTPRRTARTRRRRPRWRCPGHTAASCRPEARVAVGAGVTSGLPDRIGVCAALTEDGACAMPAGVVN